MSKINNPTNNNPIDCFKCKYLYITWDTINPRGCRAFSFKTTKMPSIVVLETSGEPCYKFILKDNILTTNKPKTS
jgi:hypothetical protein